MFLYCAINVKMLITLLEIIDCSTSIGHWINILNSEEHIL